MDATLPQFTDLELFQMFNIDIGVAALGEIKHLRRQGKRQEAKTLLKSARKRGKDLWYENKTQRNGTVENLEASKTIDTPEARASRVEALRIFYATAQEGESPFESEESEHVGI
jgi:hypothetical protein